MDETFLNKLFTDHQSCPVCPSPDRVTEFFRGLLSTIFPELSNESFSSARELALHMDHLKITLGRMIVDPFDEGRRTDKTAEQFFSQLPAIYQQLHEDATAMYNGDPASESRSEVIRTYPGFYAIAAYRIAHCLYELSVPMIPRIITEHAHSRTGIDIHPAASIGNHFCIDHGTGVVIGETTVIGDHVKIYQGVTLGALSVSKKDAAIKRHPTIGNHAVIYAGATILGGDTIIGERSVVGGNVWLTKSIPADSKIYYKAKMFNSNTDKTDLYIYKEK